METNQRGGDEKLTYEEKRQLLELALNRRPEGEEEECCYCNWVMDMDDTDVFFHFEGGSFSAPYTIESDEEGHAKAVIDFENKVPVVHSWKAYAKEDEKEPEEDKSEGEKEVEACGEKEEVKGEESCDGKETESCENKEEESCEDKAEESCGDKVEESCGDKAEESVTTEAAEGCEEKEEESCGDKQEESCGDKQEESCDEKQEESCGDKQEESCGDKQDNEAESESCGEAEENKEEGKEEESVISDDTYAEKPIISADTYEETKEEDNADKEKQDECGRFTVNDKEYNAEEFKAEFERISNELVEMTKKFNAVNEKLAEIRNGELYAFACEIVADEHELTEENAANIKDSIKAFCVEGKYATNEEAQEATEHMIADALYAQKKAAKKTGKEFSSTIIKNAVFSTVNETEAGNEETGINKLKNNVAKLKKA